MAKNTGLGKGLDALFANKSYIEDIEEEKEITKRIKKVVKK